MTLWLWPCVTVSIPSIIIKCISIASRSNHKFMTYSRNKFFTNLHIWPRSLILWPWPGVNFNNLLISVPCVSIINFQSFVHDIYLNTFLYTIAFLTFSFDFMTLTLGQIQHLIMVINHICKYNRYQIIDSWYKVETSVFTNLHIWPWSLTLWPGP